MKAVVLKEARKLAVEEVPKPVAGRNEVVVKVKYVGICGSDLHLYSHGLVPGDTIMGHEVTGVIESVGEGVAGWNRDDRVWVSGGGPCGSCESCMKGDAKACQNPLSIGLGALPGGYAEYVKVPPTFMVLLPEDLSLRDGALLDTLGCSYHAVALSGIVEGESALVMGGGPIGLFLVQCLKLRGVKPIILSEPASERARLGAELGADFVINPSEMSVDGECKKLTGGTGPDVVYECVGRSNTVLDSVNLVRPRGKVLWVGVCFDEVTFVPAFWFLRRISIQMSFGFEREEVFDCIQLLRERRVVADKLVSNLITLDEVPRAFERLQGPNSEVKILVQP